MFLVNLFEKKEPLQSSHPIDGKAWYDSKTNRYYQVPSVMTHTEFAVREFEKLMKDKGLNFKWYDTEQDHNVYNIMMMDGFVRLRYSKNLEIAGLIENVLPVLKAYHKEFHIENVYYDIHTINGEESGMLANDQIMPFIRSGGVKPDRKPLGLWEQFDPSSLPYDGEYGFISDMRNFPIRRDAVKFWLNIDTGLNYIWHDTRIDHSKVAKDLNKNINPDADDVWDDETMKKMFYQGWVRGNSIMVEGVYVFLHSRSGFVRKAIISFEDHYGDMIDGYNIDVRLSDGAGDVEKGIVMDKTTEQGIALLDRYIRRGELSNSRLANFRH